MTRLLHIQGFCRLAILSAGKLITLEKILDPMMGAGTTGVVALKLGCEFIGIDLSKEHYQTARKRLCGKYEIAERCEP